MAQIGEHVFDPREEKIAIDCLERYSGSIVSSYQSFLLLTNFPRYVDEFAKSRQIPVHEGSMFKSAHSEKEGISILDFKIGSPAAALVIDICAHLPIKAALLLGMCGGLRRQYKVGDYFVPVAAIRGEGTSDFYFPSEVPAMANFMVQKVATDQLTAENASYHIGITHSTNKRFWEFNEKFRQRLIETRPQAIEMECATLFMASYYNKLPLGALLLISDLPLEPDGVKTKRHAEKVYLDYTADHVEKGVRILQSLRESIKFESKGVYRGARKRFEDAD
ncbi:AMP nucleosidase [Waddlia chondrophila 2032/99]|uniref:AMP nucleosidase n=2 Tax=Waddlia chondrophila TaxID=71667 RepID=D6YTZ5_WADCW|nr:AMP nucleosidase [Waddlia chondrophila]ADI37606.1 AMP nucleosidase [Waddlia chondrophila WSU 86-1044]CCB91046.1 AMP nucleosidase [Waddlia chondrophila 2032/99]